MSPPPSPDFSAHLIIVSDYSLLQRNHTHTSCLCVWETGVCLCLVKHFALFGSSRVRRSMVGRFGVGYDRGLTMEAEVVCLDGRKLEDLDLDFESDNLRMEAEVVCGRREMGFRSLKGEEHLLLGGERSCYVWAGF